ncbi:hypothetical protein GCK72_015944 [Caenorhabditis remanei]|uniref:C6 domain-containing protein n=1 Tax=Caenorhabditis remanei TaxID=31234 RepID=A0A6A5GWD0_CAERE|nr:hypothetical protein GCK72_015944 [Caenorhabditis remanei]KAF1759477.1 hypothetical protein GCK72_015944 [Caenorhabditis remanei]
MMIPMTSGCLQTVPGGTPNPTDCCRAANIILTQSDLPDGLGSQTCSRDDTCCTVNTVTCTTSVPGTGLQAGIRGNGDPFLDYALETVSVQLQCSGGAWTFTNEGMTITLQTVECVLTNPPTSGG